MKKLIFIILLVIPSLLFSVDTDIKSYSFINSGQTIYKDIEIDLNGDQKVDHIVSVINKEELRKMNMLQRYGGSLKDIYFIISSTEENDEYVFKVDNNYFYSISLNQYKEMAKYYEKSQLGPLQDFYFIKDINKNNLNEIYLVEFGWYEQKLVGFEYDGSKFRNIIDIDIDGTYKNNFPVIESDELIFLRGSQYSPKKVIEPGVFRDYLGYFRYNEELGKFEEIRTEEIKTKRDDFF